MRISPRARFDTGKRRPCSSLQCCRHAMQHRSACRIVGKLQQHSQALAAAVAGFATDHAATLALVWRPWLAIMGGGGAAPGWQASVGACKYKRQDVRINPASGIPTCKRLGYLGERGKGRWCMVVCRVDLRYTWLAGDATNAKRGIAD